MSWWRWESDWGVHVRQYSFAVVAAMPADKIRWTGDPFDRVMVAHAMANGGSPLVTSDREIRKHYSPAVW